MSRPGHVTLQSVRLERDAFRGDRHPVQQTLALGLARVVDEEDGSITIGVERSSEGVEYVRMTPISQWFAWTANSV